VNDDSKGFIGTPFYQNPPAKWEMTLTEDGYLKFMLPEGPNAFHRFMQKLCLGISWKRIHK